MVQVIGVDGCRAGWLCVDVDWRDAGPISMAVRIVPEPSEILGDNKAEAVALDMPIGLADQREPGGRLCDRMARALLGPRKASVFSPPIRSLLGARSYEDVRTHGVTIQAYHILPKIAAVDAWITPQRQQRVFEAHPELCFLHLAGRPMHHPKRKAEGRRERLTALETVYPNLVEWIAAQRFPRGAMAQDDLLDALVLAWVAYLKTRGEAICLPETPPKDKRGLDMAIWY